VLLSYPTADTSALMPAVAAALESVGVSCRALVRRLRPCWIELSKGRPLRQLRRVTLICSTARVRLSLQLYEHVHGESRDRGQAMVELLKLYSSRGLELTAKELPDHLPVFLEFLSQLPSR
jgi:nitrate reductase delta subunit